METSSIGIGGIGSGCFLEFFLFGIFVLSIVKTEYSFVLNEKTYLYR